jgi:hypothetical protein
MRVHVFVVVLAVACTLTIAACGDDSTSGTASNAPGSSGPTTTGPTKAGGVTVTAGSAKLPADPCALLTLPEVQTVAPSAAKGVATTSGTISANCYWGATGQDTNSVTVSVLILPSGTAAQAKLGLQAQAKDPKVNGAEISGVGDFAVFTSTVTVDAEGQALLNGVLVNVTLNGTNARGQKDKVVALLKDVVGRM